ncbi:hypothetical protein HOD30_04075 [Candidatus Peregrinibacteria bacterium]|jgi:hypothetical protein|nr:hypothetical protein [Candidatus Peregrinibacteria bacterium]MBT4632138.1 hypothetical protein [Candidatus Peregrinibacteria bacterium]MBT5517061.1 hypothetical protein [Candidatus Peregrinibacteria bacterium]MBT5824056.1 hypothetical protein [Candidatus Peregrinibacteria bacterium]
MKLRLFIFASLFNVLIAVPAMAVSFDEGIFKKNAYLTNHFQIEFSDLIKDQPDEDGDGYSDIIEIVSEAAEDSWDHIFGELNYPEPELTLSHLILVLDDNQFLLEHGAIGVTTYLSNGDPVIGVDAWLSEDYLQITTAHELYHAMQFTIGDLYPTTAQEVNWGEATADWVTEEIYDSIDDYLLTMPDFLDNVDYSVFASIIPTDSYFPYGLNIWPRFLSEYYNDNFIKDIWEEYLDSSRLSLNHIKFYESFDAAVAGKGDDLGEVFQDFTLWNLDSEQYEEGHKYPEPTYLMGGSTGEYFVVEDKYAPALFGTNYVYFENSSSESEFYFHVVKPEGLRFAISLVPIVDDNPDLDSTVSLILDKDEFMETEMVLGGITSYDSVMAVLSPLDKDFEDGLNLNAFDVGYRYFYAAEFGSPIDSLLAEGDEEIEGPADDKEGEEATQDSGGRELDGLSLQILDYDEDSVTFSWNRPSDSDVDGYEINFGKDSGDYDHLYDVDKAYTTFATINDLDEGDTYYFELIAVDDGGRQEGDESSEVSVTPKEWLFEDISYLDKHYDAISTLVDIGVLEGYPDNTFRSDLDINRAELLKILLEAQGISPSVDEYSNCFSDVGAEWFAPYVCYAEEHDWVDGYPGGFFDPGRTVNKAEALKILFNSYEEGLIEGSSVDSLPYPDAPTDAWYSIYIFQASELGILEETPGEDFNADSGRDRGDMSEELYRYLIVKDLL